MGLEYMGLEYMGMEYMVLEFLDVECMDLEYMDIVYMDLVHTNLVYMDLVYMDLGVDHSALTLVKEAMRSMLHDWCQVKCSLILISDHKTSTTSFLELQIEQLWAPWGVTVFEVEAESNDANVTHAQLSWVITKARLLQKASWSLMVVMVSNDASFMTQLTESSLKNGVFVWSTRLLAVTSLPLSQLQTLHKFFSMTNSMLLTVDTTTLYMRFSHRPNLVVTAEEFPTQKAVMVRDIHAPGGQRLTFLGSMSNVIDFIAKGVNFSFTYVRPADRLWGARQLDGSWTGMVGMLMKKEADIALGPFGTSTDRAEVVDFTTPIWIDEWRILAAKGRPEVNPWGFLFPLTAYVWMGILGSLMMLPTIMFLSSSFFIEKLTQSIWMSYTFSFLRILLQQDFNVSLVRWWWERVLLVVWMMVTLVVTRSYSSNLMALLAVRYISQPFQSLRNVLEHPSVAMIWQKNSVNVQYIRNAKSGIIREVADLEATGRVIYMAPQEYKTAINTLVRRGTHVLVDVDISLRYLTAQDFTETGRCDFYSSREGYLPFSSGAISQKDNPIVTSLNHRVMALVESGIFVKWFIANIPNSTKCLNPPTKFTVRSSLSLANLWGMFVVVAGGTAVSLLVFCLEILSARSSSDGPPLQLT
ncbi:probable glutamate receptor [Cherax quadricarinatus]|uniref:probable glutamate receptor n=1 Tax=Cherax quadricarinatus TaxID=27406 RepID=UPI00387E4F93